LGDLENIKTKEAELAKERELQSHQFVLNLLEQRLAEGGLTDDELNFLLERGKAWGIYSDTVINDARNAISEANNLAQSISNIPSNKTTTITTQYVSVYATVSQTAPGYYAGEKRDSGGPGIAGQPYFIGVGAQPEMFIPSTNGSFVPNANIGNYNQEELLNYLKEISNKDPINYQKLARTLRDAVMQGSG
jgi:hypothetical protein